MKGNKRELSNDSNIVDRAFDISKPRQDSKKNAFHYIHPSQRPQKAWLTSKANRSSHLKENLSFNPLRSLLRSSPGNFSVITASERNMQKNENPIDKNAARDHMNINKNSSSMRNSSINDTAVSDHQGPRPISVDDCSVNSTCKVSVDANGGYDMLEPPIRPGRLIKDDTPVQTLEPQDSMKKMIEDIMRYEIRIASLYGRMAKMQKENDILRDDFKMVSERNIDLTLSLRKKLNSRSKEAFYDSAEEQSTSREDRKRKVADVVEDRDNPNGIQHFKRQNTHSTQVTDKAELSKMLEKLQRSIIKRLEEYRGVQKKLEKRFEQLEESEKHQLDSLREESPLIKHLRSNLLRVHNELKVVREFGNVRAANLKAALDLQKNNVVVLNRKLEANHVHMDKSSKSLREASKYIKSYQMAFNEQRKQILDLSDKASQINSTSAPKAIEKEQLSKSDNTTDMESLTKVIEIQREDISILNEELHQEKLKNKSLLRTLEGHNTGQQNGAIRANDHQREGLTKSYIEVLEQQAQDKENYHKRIQHIHKTYRAILHQKDVEHRNHLNSISLSFRENNEPKSLSTNVITEKKSDPNSGLVITFNDHKRAGDKT